MCPPLKEGGWTDSFGGPVDKGWTRVDNLFATRLIERTLISADVDESP